MTSLRSNANMLKRVSLGGFSLVELLVAISVMSIVAGIGLSGGGKARVRLNLADNASLVEYLIREAQLKGSAVNSAGGVFGGAGVYFSTTNATSALFFKDRVDNAIQSTLGIGDGLYNTTPIDESEKKQGVTGGNRISQLCVKQGSGLFLCGANNVPPITSLTISFIRPSQSAHIYINNSNATNYLAGCVQMDSPEAPASGYLRSIIVYQSGLIVRKSKECSQL